VRGAPRNPKMNQLRVKNHFVPECYLKRWKTVDEKIFTYRLLVRHSRVFSWKKHSVSSVAYHKHLYTQYISGKETDELERWLDKEYESPASSALEKAILDKPLSPEDWRVLIRFVAAQDVRTPQNLLNHLNRSKDTYPNILQSTLNEFKCKLENNELDYKNQDVNVGANTHTIPLKISTSRYNEDTAILRVESFIGRSSWLFTIKYLLDNSAKILHKHKWTIVKPAKGYSWFTSDNPVVKLNYLDSNNYNLKGGWGKDKGNIIFPISPDHAMFVQIGDRPLLKGTRLSIKQTNMFRKLIAENAHRMIYSNHPDSELMQLRPRLVDKEMYL
jgi:hypothetical protein